MPLHWCNSSVAEEKVAELEAAGELITAAYMNGAGATFFVTAPKKRGLFRSSRAVETR